MEEPSSENGHWQDILDFERDWWKGSLRKERAVRARFGLSSARYYQLLNRLIDRPEALEYDPTLVQRLRRLRARRKGRGMAPLPAQCKSS